MKEVRLAPERFYWGVLEALSLPRASGARRRGLGYLLESVLPVPIETVHAVYLDLDDGRVLACAVDRAALEGSEPALVFGPRELPACVGALTGVDAEAINLLVGEYEPPGVRRARRRTVLLIACAIFGSSLALLAGQARRASRWDEAALRATEATGSLYSQVLPPSTSALPPSARLTAELRALDRTRPGTPAAGPREITPTLAGLLASWPADLQARTDALSAAPGSITLTVRLPEQADAERLERELRPPAGWRLGQPDVQRDRDGLTVRVRLEPEP
ncbi:MAG: hypothetical protein IPJ41_16960 [Phycisphaerales bacterium]|nr:hypothetical protein [Phycisphaerales bacterium]